MRFFSLVLILTVACGAEVASANTLRSQMISAREKLRTLCKVKAQSPFCPGADFRLEGHQSLNAEDDLGIESELKVELSAAAREIFHFKERVQAKGTKAVSTAERNTYLQQMRYLDKVSRAGNRFEVRIIEIMSLLLTMEWVDTYGDPLRTTNLFVDESNKSLPGRAAHQQSEYREFLTNSIYAAGSLGAMFLADQVSKSTRNILNGARIILLGIRTRLPLDIIAAGAQGVLLGIAGRNADKSKEIWRTLLPAPAHLIKFELNADLEIEDLDFQTIWAQKEFELYQRAAVDYGRWGGMFTAAHFAQKYGIKMGSHFWTSGSKLIRFVRFFRITPTTAVAGWGVGEVVKNILGIRQKQNISREVEAAVSEKDELGVFSALGHHSLAIGGSMMIPKTTIQFYQTIYAAALAANSGNHEAYASQRFILSGLLKGLNLPAETGAGKFSQWICQMANDDEVAKQALPLQGQHFLGQKTVTKLGAKIFTESQDVAKKMTKVLSNAYSSQREHLQFLKSLQSSHSKPSAIISFYHKDTPDWLAKHPSVRRILAGKIKKTEANIARFDRATQVAKNRQMHLSKRLTTWAEKIYLMERQQGFQNTATFFNCR